MPRRKPTRLASFDYRAPGAYFITLVTHERACLFGGVEGGTMVLNAAGWMVEDWWLSPPGKFPNVALDTHIIMPNHFHGLVALNADFSVGVDPRVGPEKSGAHTSAPLQRKFVSLPEIMRWFKTMTTNAYIRNPPFNKHLWQRSYHDRIVRNETELNRLRECVANNPIRWHLDQENPEHCFWANRHHPQN